MNSDRHTNKEKYHKLSLMVPSINGTGTIPKKTRKFVLKECRKVICQMCGGVTEWDALGSWQYKNELLSEKVTVISANFFGNLGEIVESLNDLCLWVKEILQQERVAIEIDSALYLI